jgi:ABC-type branched-subunit amino acid transport system ATPase component
MNETPLLSLKGVTKHFGGVKAVDGVDMIGLAGQVHGLIGPNGAGKSTLIGCITGVNRINGGEIRLAGQRLDTLTIHQRARLGVGRTFQKIRLPAQLTVYEAVASGLAAAWFSRGGHGWRRVFTSLRAPVIAEPVRAALAEAGLEDIADVRVGSVPYGRRHFVELARTLVAEPTLIFMDEPATGMTAQERERFSRQVRKVAAGGRLVVLVEHDLTLVGELCDQVTVIEQGRRIFTGTPTQAQGDPAVVRAYLGSMSFVATDATTTEVRS